MSRGLDKLYLVWVEAEGGRVVQHCFFVEISDPSTCRVYTEETLQSRNRSSELVVINTGTNQLHEAETILKS